MRNGEWRPRVDSQVTWIEVDGEAIAIGPWSSNLHLLNRTGAAMLQLLDGSTSVREIADDVGAVFGIPLDDALAQVVDFADTLADCGLLESLTGGDDRTQVARSKPPVAVQQEPPTAPRYLIAPPDP